MNTPRYNSKTKSPSATGRRSLRTLNERLRSRLLLQSCQRQLSFEWLEQRSLLAADTLLWNPESTRAGLDDSSTMTLAMLDESLLDKSVSAEPISAESISEESLSVNAWSRIAFDDDALIQLRLGQGLVQITQGDLLTIQFPNQTLEQSEGMENYAYLALTYPSQQLTPDWAQLSAPGVNNELADRSDTSESSSSGTPDSDDTQENVQVGQIEVIMSASRTFDALWKVDVIGDSSQDEHAVKGLHAVITPLDAQSGQPVPEDVVNYATLILIPSDTGVIAYRTDQYAADRWSSSSTNGFTPLDDLIDHIATSDSRVLETIGKTRSDAAANGLAGTNETEPMVDGPTTTLNLPPFDRSQVPWIPPVTPLPGRSSAASPSGMDGNLKTAQSTIDITVSNWKTSAARRAIESADTNFDTNLAAAAALETTESLFAADVKVPSAERWTTKSMARASATRMTSAAFLIERMVEEEPAAQVMSAPSAEDTTASADAEPARLPVGEEDLISPSPVAERPSAVAGVVDQLAGSPLGLLMAIGGIAVFARRPKPPVAGLVRVQNV